MRILIVEDEQSLQQQLAQSLREQEYVVDVASDGEEGLYFAKEYPIDLAIVDLGLPKLDGVELIKRVRIAGLGYPILILTARNRWQEKVAGLEAGADDYLSKPFDMQELAARLRVFERRLSTASSSKICIGEVELDTAAHSVNIAGNPVEMPRREYMLLKTLMESAGKVLTRESLEARLYSWGEEVSSNALEVHIHHLRKKLPDKLIKTVRGIGYTVSGV